MRNSTAIEYYVPTAQRVSLRIYDVSGQLVKTLLDSPMEAGTHQAVWNGLDEQGRAVSSGVYFYQLQGETENTTKKLVVTR
jgi:flagellar hook assembly protein FlgD